MDAQKRTKNLKRKFVPIDSLLPNPENPNEMSKAQFNLLFDNIGKMGITDPILVRPHPKIKGKYRIVGGEHRWEVAKLHDFEEVPVTIVDDEDFDEDKERFQVVRHNIIHGKMSPKKFLNMYNALAKKYSDEVAAESFGFELEEEFKKLVKATGETLPKDMQAEFKDAAKEIKTIDELSGLLNHMFANYGDTLDCGYMIIDYGGQDSVWLRLGKGSFSNFQEVARRLKERSKTADHWMDEVLRVMSDSEFDFDAFVEGLPEKLEVVEVEIPTLDALDALGDE